MTFQLTPRRSREKFEEGSERGGLERSARGEVGQARVPRSSNGQPDRPPMRLVKQEQEPEESGDEDGEQGPDHESEGDSERGPEDGA